MKRVWIATAEVRVQPGDMSSGNTLGFMKVSMWADSEADFRCKLRQDLDQYSWELLSVERLEEVDCDRDYGDDINQLIDETLQDRGAIRFGTYYSYTPE